MLSRSTLPNFLFSEIARVPDRKRDNRESKQMPGLASVIRDVQVKTGQLVGLIDAKNVIKTFFKKTEILFMVLLIYLLNHMAHYGHGEK